MPPLVTRATVVRALTRREAELLQQPPASGHTLVAIIWEGEWIAAQALADAGLPAGSEHQIRKQLADLPASERGMDASELLHQASVVAKELGHGHIGTEHQLLAIIDDEALSELVLSSEARRQARASIHTRLELHADTLSRLGATRAER
jgi:hypothetical protein